MDEGFVQLLGADGVAVADSRYQSGLSIEEVFSLWRDMTIVRRIDKEGTTLQRQGQLALWAPVEGQEAAQVGLGRAMASTDFSFPTYRDHGVAWCRGIPPLAWFRLFRAVSNGGWDPYEYNHSLPAIALGNQVLTAVGYAMGIELDGAKEAAVALFGDGAMSQGDTNEAFVWAAAFNAPVVFFCQNNHWAISEPVERQSHTPLYKRAAGFGFSGEQVDGNDVLAVLEVSKHALEKARSGGGPSLIEAFTYRMGAHTTSDDPTRYRDGAEVEKWRGLDPIRRVRTFLEKSGFAQERLEEVEAEAEALATEVRAGVLAMEKPRFSSMLDNVYAEDHPLVEAARTEMLELGVDGD